MASKNPYESAWNQHLPVKEQLKITGRLLGFARYYKKQFIGAIVMSFALAIINILLPRVIQEFMNGSLAKHNATTAVILGVGLVYAIGTIIKAIVQFCSNFFFSMGAERAMEDVRRQLFAKLHSLGMRYFDLTPAGSVVSRVTNDTMTLTDFWNVFMSLLVGVFSIITALVAMYANNHTAAWIVAAFIPILLLVTWAYNRYSSKVYRHMRAKLSELNAKLNESIEGVEIIQNFQQQKRVDSEFESVNNDYLDSRRAMIKTNSLLLSSFLNLIYVFALTAVLIHFGIMAQTAVVAAGTIYVFSSYIQSFFNPLGNLMDQLQFFQDGVVAGSRIFHILDSQELAPKQNPDANAVVQEGKVEFRHVSFSYDGENEVLHDISFIVKPGETIGLVGHTGSGKSSIINVMMRFYEFYHGEILIDDRDIRDYPIAELRRKLGLVLQDSFLFYGDIAFNIRLFNEKISDADVKKAAEFVQADSFIEKLPNKYHARVIEGGAQFSSGQRQLISFARTVAADPKILVLDEATANIDTETETLIQDGLRKLRQGRTTIAIAHRLSTIRDASQILVLDKGRIVEAGTHEELLAQKGRYYDMYRLQMGEHVDID
jgi:ATP-binding cassette subfamily B protein